MSDAMAAPVEQDADEVAFVLCGALGREVRDIVLRHGWRVRLFGVSALDHLVPGRIAPDVERRLREVIPQFGRVVVVYGDCGTAGSLDAVLQAYNVPRIAGPHCYEMYAGPSFESLMDEEPGTFFLTDFMVRAFEGTVRKGLGLDRYPELQEVYWANYTRVVYLAQRPDEQLIERAQAIAASLGLSFEIRPTGYGLLEERLVVLMAEIHHEHYRPTLPPPNEEHPDDKLPGPVLARHPAPGAGSRRGRSRQRPAA